VITTEFRRLCNRVPNPEEYRVLRDILNGEAEETEVERAGLKSPAMARVLAEAGRGSGTFRERLEALFLRMMDEVVRITRDAIDLLKLNVLVFPQGTRSIRLSRGHIGLAQMAQSLGAPIVPVGCNGSDHLYPSSSPFSRGGRVVYRIGRPLLPDGPELGPHRIPVPFAPFRREVEEQFGAQLRAITDVVMDRINDLLDEPYRFSEDRESEGVRGVNRFL
jgi:1-acyl-sn-glycerol-3-phosphate acyltransferase